MWDNDGNLHLLCKLSQQFADSFSSFLISLNTKFKLTLKPILYACKEKEDCR